MNPETNLPSLPEGRFWRIKKGWYPVLYKIELREKRKHFGSRFLSDALIWKIDSLADIQRKASRLVSGFPDCAPIAVGDYPPNKLGRIEAQK